MYLDTTFPPPDGRLAGLMRELNALGSTDIGAAIDAMIAALDQRDGDPDLEPNGDELDASWPSSGGTPRDAMRCGAGHEDAEDDDEAEDDDPREMTARNGTQWWDGSTTRTDDDEEDPDCCGAGDDRIIAGPVFHLDWRRTAHHPSAARAGDDDDAEHSEPPAYRLDQSADLYITAANDWPELAA